MSNSFNPYDPEEPHDENAPLNPTPQPVFANQPELVSSPPPPLEFQDFQAYENFLGPSSPTTTAASLPPPPPVSLPSPPSEISVEVPPPVDQQQQQPQQPSSPPSAPAAQPGVPQPDAERDKQAPLYKVAHYRQFFNVDTKDVLKRLALSFIPIKPMFADHAKENPDLYGPFWVTTTLIMMVAITSNLQGYLSWIKTAASTDHWTYDFSVVSIAGISLYSYVIGVPLLLWFLLRWKNVKTSLVLTVGVFGYALFMFIPIAALCVIPSNAFQWILISAAFLLSTAFIVVNMWSSFAAVQERTWKTGLPVTTVLLNAGLCLFFKLYFFSYDV